MQKVPNNREARETARKLYTKVVAAIVAACLVAWLAVAAGGALAANSRDDTETRSWQDQAVDAGFTAYLEYVKSGCMPPTEQQREAYAAAKAVSPQVFGEDRLNYGMCAPVPATLPLSEPRATRTVSPTPAPVPPTTSA